MLLFDKLSFWERRFYLESIDFIIVGSGIVGLTCAIQLKKKFKSSKILILERGYLPTGASTKNAGFACFGSPTEILDDLEKSKEQVVWDTIQMRYEGLIKLFELVGKRKIKYTNCSSWELIEEDEIKLSQEKINWLNQKLERIIKEKNVYSFDDKSIKKNGLKGFGQAIKNRLEGAISTDLLMSTLIQLAHSNGIYILNGINILNFSDSGKGVLLQSNFGEFQCNKLIICSNGFSNKLLPKLDVVPSRAQVLITKPIYNLKLRGTFHSQKGYYYFRNIENRILLGGARCVDFSGENTDKFENTHSITSELRSYLTKHFTDSQKFEIDHYWSGIMGTGNEKKPIVQKINKNVFCGVRMGGMGIAIGTEIGNKLVELVSNE